MCLRPEMRPTLRPPDRRIESIVAGAARGVLASAATSDWISAPLKEPASSRTHHRWPRSTACGDRWCAPLALASAQWRPSDRVPGVGARGLSEPCRCVRSAGRRRPFGGRPEALLRTFAAVAPSLSEPLGPPTCVLAQPMAAERGDRKLILVCTGRSRPATYGQRHERMKQPINWFSRPPEVPVLVLPRRTMRCVEEMWLLVVAANTAAIAEYSGEGSVMTPISAILISSWRYPPFEGDCPALSRADPSPQLRHHPRSYGQDCRPPGRGAVRARR